MTAPSRDTVSELIGARAMFMRPQYLEKSAWLEHIPFAFWAVTAVKPRVIVELGTHNGSSYFAFCQAVERLSLLTKCYAIDTWTGDEHAGFYGSEVYLNVSHYNDANYSSFSSLIRSKFDDALPYFSDNTIDILHIDGLHTVDAVENDFSKWLPKLSSRAIVILHDTNVRERGFGVFKFFERIKLKFPHFEFIHGHGLGVLGVGQEQTAMMTRLFDAFSESDSVFEIRDLFSRTGRYCADSYNLKIERERADRLAHALNKALDEIDLLKSQADQYALGPKLTQLILGYHEGESRSSDEGAMEQPVPKSGETWRYRSEFVHDSLADQPRSGPSPELLPASLLAIDPVSTREWPADDQAKLITQLSNVFSARPIDAIALQEVNNLLVSSDPDSRRRYVDWIARVLREKHHFDVDGYLERYPDVVAAGLGAAEHFVRHGAIEGRRFVSRG